MEKKKAFLTIVFILSWALTVQADTHKDFSARNDSLLNLLDKYIADSRQLRQRHDASIGTLRSAYHASTSWQARYDLSRQLYEKYETYITDSAFFYLRQGLTAAEHIGDKDKIYATKCLLIKQYTKTGFYAEAVLTMNQIDSTRLNVENSIAYYDASSYLFNTMAFFSKDKADKVHFQDIANERTQRLMALLPHDSQLWLLNTQDRLLKIGNYRAALQTLDILSGKVKQGEHNYAIIEMSRYFIYEKLGKKDEALYHLLQSVINDVSTVTYDEAAIFYLCRMLREKGDVKRAHQYIKYAYGVSTVFGAKMKDWITNDIEKVNSKFQDLLLISNRTMLFICVIFGLLAIIVIIFGIYLMIQHRKLRESASELRLSNGKLNDANTKLHQLLKKNAEANEQLAQLLEQNTKVSKYLEEANTVKEKSIGIFFALCTHYIDETRMILQKFNKMLRNRQFEEMMQMTKGSDIQDNATQELYQQFDKMFLEIYPAFVEDFNELVEPEGRMIPMKEGTLNTQLRIFALIRLGIDDSTKISRLLHLANSTVYNYRNKFRGLAIGDRSTFEDKVKGIGSPKI